MPKSKRDKKISLTKTKKKGLELKQHIIEDIRESAEKYARIFLFSVQNMRNNKLKDLRAEWMDSRFFFGKNKIMALAFGKSEELEVSEGAHKLANALKGQCGLLFTNRPKKKKLLGRALATFKLKPLGVYTKKHGYKKLSNDTENEMDVDEEKT
ncbi:mRNA turnover protein 4 homolog [Belonocnema kinseyi]|uniref:mRNA turnover protein 4 homolog n=1 Tax=Belonocnema kinseyi TaxID=2817044 RepID=UPI00143D060B|nr:mRNA turnover protein 4 homolog [Belonocnema kinseyi]